MTMIPGQLVLHRWHCCCRSCADQSLVQDTSAWCPAAKGETEVPVLLWFGCSSAGCCDLSGNSHHLILVLLLRDAVRPVAV